MHEFSLRYLRCVECGSKLESEIFNDKTEIEEGFLICKRCNGQYPIISKVPILWPGLSAYLSNRAQLGGKLFTQSRNPKLKTFVKNAMKKISKNSDDVSAIEKRWVTIYQNSKRSRFYSIMKKLLKKIPRCGLVLDHGCSIGYMTENLASNHDTVFGIDQSYWAIYLAKQNAFENLDYFVAHSLYHPFGRNKFQLVVGLNVLELIEPVDFLRVVSSQIRNGYVAISDPYDYERGKNIVRNPMDSKTLRSELEKLGFKIMSKTRKASFIPWKLNINPRTKLDYRLDLVIAKKM